MTFTDTPMVSIVVPSYNYGKFILSCLQSVAAQTYPNMELVIVDDASKDDSIELIKRLIQDQAFSKRFAGGVVLLQHETNKGAHNTINDGLASSKGELLTVINADDLYEPDRFTRMVDQLICQGSQLAFSKVKVIDEMDKEITDLDEEAGTFYRIQKNIAQFPTVGFSLFPHNVAISTGNMLFSRTLYDKVGPFKNLKYCHDWDFILRCLLHEEPVYVETTHYCYRLHGNNTFRSLGKIMNQEVKAVLGSFFREVRKRKFSNAVTFSVENYPETFKKVISNCNLQSFWRLSKGYVFLFLRLRESFARK